MGSYSFLHILAISFAFSFISLANAHYKNNNEGSSALHSKFKGSFSKVFAFGDSYTDTGNAHVLGEVTASGESSSRFSNGRLIVDFLSEALAIPPLPPYKGTSVNFSHGVNFAVAGSTALSLDFFAKGNIKTLICQKTPMSFQTQIDWFKNFQLEMGGKGKIGDSFKTEMDNALFWIGEMGVNDYSRTIGSSFSLRWLAEKSVTHVFQLLETLLNSGAKYIVVSGLPPIGCLPIGLSLCPLHDRDRMGCASIANTAIMIHNQILQRKLEYLQKIHSNCSILYADTWNAYLTILTNTKKYNFQESFKACCGSGAGELNFNSRSLCGSPGSTTCKDPNNYITWDGIHLTEAMNQHIADLFLNQGFCRPSFNDLIKSKSGM